MKVLPPIAYCMNLDKRTDRWEQVVKDFCRLQTVMYIDIQRVLSVENLKEPQKGAARTFKNIITMAKNNKLPYVLILEDDLFVIDPIKVVNALEDVPPDWDILLGGSYHYVPDKKYSDNWMKMKDFCGLHFIIIRARLYDKILDIKETAQHIDRVIGGLTKRGHVTTYLMYPMPCQQRPGFSNIRKRHVDDNRRKLPWIDHPDTLAH